MSKFRENQKVFKAEFNQAFTQKLLEYQGVAVGRQEAQVKYSTLGGMVKSILETAISKSAEAIPFIGPFVGDILVSIPTRIYEYKQRQKITNTAEERSNEVAKIGEAMIQKVIEETSHEITRIFEYQIAMLQHPVDAAKLAQFAADKIFDSGVAISSGNVGFDSEWLVNLLLQPESSKFIDKLESKINGEKRLDTVITLSSGKNVKWKIGDIFTKPGLRLEDSSTDYVYKSLPGQELEINNYGFRGPLFLWDKDIKAFRSSPLDTIFTEVLIKNISDPAISYIPYQRLVQQSDLDLYLASLKRTDTIVPFVQFFKIHYSLDQEVYPVFRNVKIEGDIFRADFSNTDMSRMVIGHSEIESVFTCRFDGTRIVGSEFSNCNMENSWFKNADLRWSILNSVILRGDTILTGADLSYAILGQETDLTDNFSFGSARTDESYIITDKVVSTVLKRILASESQNVRLEQQIQELLEREAKLEIMLSSMKVLSPGITDELDFFNVRDAVDDFTGRESVLTKISEYFASRSNAFAVQVIAAMGGMGKTQTALKYVSENKSKYGNEGYERVFWISAETQDTLNTSFRSFASKLKIDISGKKNEDVLAEVQKKLAILPKTLFIFDNVEDRDLIRDYLPKPSSKHHIIITTRNVTREDWAGYEIEQLNAFSMEEAYLYIKKAKPDAQEVDVVKLSEAFENLPLGLSQAIAYIREYGCEIDEYLIYYNHSHSNALRGLGEIDVSHSSLYTTFSIAVDAITGRFPGAVEMMQICSYLYPDKIPARIFTDMFLDKMTMLKSIKILQNSGLLVAKIENGERLLYLHRLVQDVVRIKLKNTAEDINILLKTANLLHTNMLNYSAKYETKDTFGKNNALKSHAYAVTSYIKDIEQSLYDEKDGIEGQYRELLLISGKLYIDLAKLQGYQRNDDQGLEVLNNALRIYKLVLGANHIDIAFVLSKIGKVLFLKGALDKAIEIYQEAMAIREINLGHDHPEIANNFKDIGFCYKNKGDLNNAKLAFLEALRIQKLTLDSDHLDIAGTLSGLGDIYRDIQELQEAFKLYQEALDVHVSVFGCKTVSCTAILNNIARIYHSQGNSEKALSFFQEALKLRELEFGHDHLDVASSLNSIGRVYHDLGNLEKALEFYSESIRIKKAIGKDNTSDMAFSLNDLGRVYHAQGNLEKALETHYESLRMKEAIFGHDFPAVAASAFQLGTVYRDQGNLQKSIEMFQEALRIRELTLERNHPSVLEILKEISLTQETLKIEGQKLEVEAVHNVFVTPILESNDMENENHVQELGSVDKGSCCCIIM